MTDSISTMLGRPNERCAVKALNATISIGTERRDHGLMFRLSGDTTSRGTCIRSMNLHGHSFFRALPNGLGNMAQMMLPVGICSRSESTLKKQKKKQQHRKNENSKNKKNTDDDDEKEQGQQPAWCQVFTLGASRVSKKRILDTLQEIKERGDPPFLFEFRGSNDQLVGFLPSRASLMLAGLAADMGDNKEKANKSIVDNGVLALKEFQPSIVSHVCGWLRWWLLPLLFLALSLQLLQRPEQILPRVPRAFSRSAAGSMSVASTLPPIPSTMAQAFRLGELRAQLEDAKELEQHPLGGGGGRGGAEKSSSELLADVLLRQAAQVLAAGQRGGSRDHGDVTADHLEGMLREIEDFEAQEGLVARVRGFFSFVNTMWLMAIVGISVSIGPSLFHLLRPLHDVLRRCARWLLEAVLLPLAKRLHTWGVVEIAAWVVCFHFVCEGVRIHTGESGAGNAEAGEMVSLTGSFLAAPALAYTTSLRGRRCAAPRLACLAELYLAATCAPWAVLFDSATYGYACVALLFAALGFGVWAGHLCVAVGFADANAVERVALSSLTLLAAFVGAKECGGAPRAVLRPFAPAVSALGSVALLLAGLIVSSDGYERARTRCARVPFWLRNAMMSFLLVGMNFLGNVTGIVAIANAATTFTALFALQKYAEVHRSNKWNPWVLLLIVSVLTWRASLYLHTNPGLVTSIFSGDMGNGW